jgi:hypothetical protein
VSDKLDPKIHTAARKSLQRMAQLQAERAMMKWSAGCLEAVVDIHFCTLLCCISHSKLLWTRFISAFCIGQGGITKVVIQSNKVGLGRTVLSFDFWKNCPLPWNPFLGIDLEPYYSSILWSSLILAFHFTLCLQSLCCSPFSDFWTCRTVMVFQGLGFCIVHHK